MLMAILSLLSMPPQKVAIVVGAAGQVGRGVSESFALGRWDVVAIDPNINEYFREQPRISCVGKRVEELSDEQIRSYLMEKGCRHICYVADEGNRDVYASNPELRRENDDRFSSFVERVCEVWQTIRPQRRNGEKIHVSYCGGSWTRRQMNRNFVVSDDSPAKDGGGSNNYERAKTDAFDNARRLSWMYGRWIDVTFFDYISVVPNYSPNFTMGKMVRDALELRKIAFSDGDFGRPLLHGRQAGGVLVALAEKWRSKQSDDPSDDDKPSDGFDSVLLPGHFTTFRRFAEIAKEVAIEYCDNLSDGDVVLEPRENTPDFLRSRCVSPRLRGEIGFVPDAAMVDEGLRDTAAEAAKNWLAASSPKNMD